MDKISKALRSRNMASIKSKDTRPEKLVRKYIYGLGLRYRICSKELPGKPDIVFRKYKTVIFINGCFWHRHKNCKYAVMPKTNVDFWREKLLKNVARDKVIQKQLKVKGYKVLVIWACDISNGVNYKTERMIKKAFNL